LAFEVAFPMKFPYQISVSNFVLPHLNYMQADTVIKLKWSYSIFRHRQTDRQTDRQTLHTDRHLLD